MSGLNSCELDMGYSLYSVLWVWGLLCTYSFLFKYYLDTRRLIVVLQEKTYIYDINSLAILDAIDTVPNLKGEPGI